jgi:hypothetical protein
MKNKLKLFLSFAEKLNYFFAIYVFVLTSVFLSVGIIENIINFNMYLMTIPIYILGLMHLFLSKLFKELTKNIVQKEVNL